MWYYLRLTVTFIVIICFWMTGHFYKLPVSLLNSHVVPLNPGAHKHVNLFGPVLLHVAPFKHGVLRHEFKSLTKGKDI